jgi:hypothetical protein
MMMLPIRRQDGANKLAASALAGSIGLKGGALSQLACPEV